MRDTLRNSPFGPSMQALVVALWVALVASPLTLSAVPAEPKSDGLRAFDVGDYATASALLRPLANEGDADAQNALGKMMLAGGPGVARDNGAALAWFRKAAAQGHAEAKSAARAR